MKLSPAAVLAASAAISGMAAVSHATASSSATQHTVNATAAAAAANRTTMGNATTTTTNNATTSSDQNRTSFTDVDSVPEAMDVDGEYLDGDSFDDGASETWVGSFPGMANEDEEEVKIDIDDDDEGGNLFDTLFNFEEDDGEYMDRRLEGTLAASNASSGCLGSGCPDFQTNMTHNESFAKRMEWSAPNATINNISAISNANATSSVNESSRINGSNVNASRTNSSS